MTLAASASWLWRAAVLAVAVWLASRYGSPFTEIRHAVYIGLLFSLVNLLDTDDHDIEPPLDDVFLKSLSHRETAAVVLLVLAGVGATGVAFVRLANALPDRWSGQWPWWFGVPAGLVVIGAGVLLGSAEAKRVISYARSRGQ